MTQNSKRKMFGPIRALIVALILTPLAIFSMAQDVHAKTAAGTAIINSVSVAYKNAAGTAQTPVTGTVTVTVSLVGSVAWVGTPTNQTVNSAQAITNYTVQLKNLGNGSDTFTLTPSDGTTEVTPADLTTGSFTVTPDESGAGVEITLFGTIASRALVVGDFDGTNTTIPVGNLTVGDLTPGTTKIVIEGGATEYNVAAGSTATQLVLVGNLTGLAAFATAGAQIGEIATVTLGGTAGALSAGVTSSVHTHQLTATGLVQNGNTAPTSVSVSWTTTVVGSALTVTKYVRNVDNANGNTGGTGGTVVNGGSTYYTGNVTGNPTNKLEYAIVITNTGPGKATDVVMEDTFSAFTTLVGTSIKVDTDNNGSYDVTGSVTNDDDIVDTDTGVAATATKIKVFAGTGGDSTTAPAGYAGGTGGEIAGGGAVTSVILYQVTID